MKAYLMPSAVGEATVILDGRPVGTVRQTLAPTPFTGMDGTKRVGKRWLPADVPVEKYPPGEPGPTTRVEAALLLLALAGHDPTEAAEALGFKIGDAA